MKNILVSAFACDPFKGSEPGNGWNWSIGIAQRGYKVHCITRGTNKESINKVPQIHNIVFVYVSLPKFIEKLYYSSSLGMYIYYILWQWYAYIKAKKLHSKFKFELAHHVTWGSTQMGSFLYKLDIPFIFGPAGGGQIAPKSLRQYFFHHWGTEKKREFISNLFFKFNPAFFNMVNKAAMVIVSNKETKELVERRGAKNVTLLLDAALPISFYPSTFHPKEGFGKLKLLWVGRFMPRKGLLLILDVMAKLKHLDIILTVVGDGEMRDIFLDRVKKLDLDKNIIWVGNVDYQKVKEYYLSHDLFFFTSLRDSCPAQLIEAMAYGLPVVTLDLHGQALIVNNSNGIKCYSEDSGELINLLKEAILKFFYNREYLKEISINAYNFSLNQTWDKKIDNVLLKFYPPL